MLWVCYYVMGNEASYGRGDGGIARDEHLFFRLVDILVACFGDCDCQPLYYIIFPNV